MQGQYEVVERIAVGGMAEIYLGVAHGAEGFSRPVVIKKVRPRLCNDSRFVQMLIREAKITASLNHPNIVQILDLGQNEEAEHFIVMEFVDGRDLRSVMDRSVSRGVKIGIDRAVYIASEICAGLHHAHRKTDEQGRPLHLIHRDVSPSNILISFAGEVKLTDFGIARYGRDVSVVGSLKGKLAYMSPEQARARPVDHRSDIFSVAAILFELVLGRRLFSGESDLEMLKQVRSASIPLPSALDPSVPLALEHLLLRALAPDPAARFQTAEELQSALREFNFHHHSGQVGARDLAALLEQLFPDRRDPRPHRVERRFTVSTVSGLLALPPETPPPEQVTADPLRSYPPDAPTSVVRPSPELLRSLRRGHSTLAPAAHPTGHQRPEDGKEGIPELLVPLPSRREAPATTPAAREASPQVDADEVPLPDPARLRHPGQTGRKRARQGAADVEELLLLLTAIPSLAEQDEEPASSEAPAPHGASGPPPPLEKPGASQASRSFSGPPPPHGPGRKSAAEELPAPALRPPSGSRRTWGWPVLFVLVLAGAVPLALLTWKHERSQPEPLQSDDAGTGDRGALVDTALTSREEATVAAGGNAPAVDAEAPHQATIPSGRGAPAAARSPLPRQSAGRLLAPDRRPRGLPAERR